jgi:hypothetical protein
MEMADLAPIIARAPAHRDRIAEVETNFEEEFDEAGNG